MTNYKKMTSLLFTLWIYTVLVILWGAWVRISHSGDGCGNHWPLCGGEFIPSEATRHTWIEYTHRLMSGFYGILVFFIFFKIKKMAQTRFLKNLNFIFLSLMIAEALLGALLVKGSLVSLNDSIFRLVVMSFHQLNSFLLSGVTFLTYLVVKNKEENIQLIQKKILALFLFVPVTGAIASLSTTLFPTSSLLQGILEDMSSDSHLFIRLRILHPVIASVFCLSLIAYLLYKDKVKLALEILFVMVIGIITLITLSPIYLKVLHLFLAHAIWARIIYKCSIRPDSKMR